MKSIKTIVMAMLFACVVGVVAAPSQAWAVATLEVTVTDGDNVLPGEKISLFTANGEQVEEDDDKGGIWFFKDLEPGQYTVRSGGKTVRTVNITPADKVKRIGVTVAPVALLDTPNTPNWPNGGDGNLSIGLRGFGKSGNFDSRLDYVGTSTTRGDTDIRDLGFGVDLVYRPPNMADFFLMPGFAWMPSAEERGSIADLHPTAGDDSFLNFAEEYYFRLLFGYTFYRAQQVEFDLLGGVQLTQTELDLVTDESGGGGNLERFSKDDLQISPVIGVQGRHLFNNGISLYGGVTATRMQDVTVRGTSSLSNNYVGRVDGGWQTEASLGLLFPF